MAGRDLIVLGIEGNTALFSNGEQYEVLGSGGVVVWKKGSKTRYNRGPLPPDIFTT
jgi:cyanophycinase-like exopeptidase